MEILAIFDLQVNPILPTKFVESVGLSVQEKKPKIDFQGGGQLGFPFGIILAIFDLQVALMLPTKYQVNWPRSVGGVGFLKQLLTPHDGRQMVILSLPLIKKGSCQFLAKECAQYWLTA